MTTPIYDFVRRYADSDTVRMHMPGHKGSGFLGCEPCDLTEIAGADELFAPAGIIAESEANASRCFGCTTLYSAEGSSLCIRAMLYLAVRDAVRRGKKPVIAAARNVHRTFLTAAALLDFEILWLPQTPADGYLRCTVTPERLTELWENAPEKPSALYLTSPDYLGNLTDIRAAADFCHAHDMLLLTDCAHGAYLHWVGSSLHPVTLGADLCCDSAHKTLPVLTGGAYLHISDDAPRACFREARGALAMFASTSPSYLILASLDRCNRWLNDEAAARISETAESVRVCREMLTLHGWQLAGDEPLKLTVMPKSCGWLGTELADYLRRNGIECEFADPDHLVLMPGCTQGRDAMRRVTQALLSAERRPPVTVRPPVLPLPKRVMHPRAVMLAETAVIPAAESAGRICAEMTVSCPPAVPLVMTGERIGAEAPACFAYYGVEKISVVISPVD